MAIYSDKQGILDRQEEMRYRQELKRERKKFKKKKEETKLKNKLFSSIKSTT